MFVAHPNTPREAQGRQALGYWRSAEGSYHDKRYDFLPDPRDFVDPSWDPEEKAIVLSYVKNQPDLIQWRGWSSCRICGTHNGSTCQGDAAFIWPQGFVHYIEAHNVKPPQAFIDHVKRVLADEDRRFAEPEPTEEDLRRMQEIEARMEAERLEAIAAGERLPPISADLWRTRD